MAELKLKESYLVDTEGKRIGVLLSLSDYQALMNRLEELEAFRSANDINVMDDLLRDGTSRSSETQFPAYRQRRGPGGMIVI